MANPVAYRWNGSSWIPVVGQAVSYLLHPVFGRLTTETGVPISSADRTAQSTLYFTPYNGNMIALFTNSVWGMYTFTERSLTLSGLTSGKNYDVFIYDNSGTVTLELSAAWTNDTTRANALTTQDGIYVKSGSTSRRWLGMIRTTGTTTTEDSLTKRFVWNYYNRTSKTMYKTDNTQHNYGTTTDREWNNSTSNRVEWISGELQSINLSLIGDVLNAINYAKIGIGINSSTPSTYCTSPAGGPYQVISCSMTDTGSVGYRYAQVTEYAATSSTGTFYSFNMWGNAFC